MVWRSVVACFANRRGGVYHGIGGNEGQVNIFYRNSQAIAVFFAASAVMAAIFGAVSWGGSPVMPASYGAIVYAIPLLWWVGIQFVTSMIALIGAAFQRPVPAAIGAGSTGALFIFFAASATFGGFAEPYLVSMAWPCSGICFLAALVSWRGRDER